MYDIKQFRPTLYFLILLGMAGFALASQSPAAWVIGCGGVLLNAWLVKTGRFRPLPRVIANLVTVAAMAFVARQLYRSNGTNTVLVIGQFLVALQLVKLWEQRANRDFGQVLVLSVLLMVAASINTASLLFGAAADRLPVHRAVLLPAVPPEGRDRRRPRPRCRCRRRRSARPRCGRTSGTSPGRCAG